MQTKMLLEFIEKFQTLAAATIALIGVVATLSVNAKAARNHQSRHWEKETNSIRTAIRAEIFQMSKAMDTQRKSLQKNARSENNVALIPTRKMDSVFASLLSRIGNLEVVEVEAAMAVYAQYWTYRDKIDIIGLPHSTADYVGIPSDFRSVIAAHNEYVIEKAAEALEVLQT